MTAAGVTGFIAFIIVFRIRKRKKTGLYHKTESDKKIYELTIDHKPHIKV